MIIRNDGDWRFVATCALASIPSPSVRYTFSSSRRSLLMRQPLQSPGNMSVEEFARYPTPEGYRAELVRGELRLTPPPGARHALIHTAIVRVLEAHVRAVNLGHVFI